MPKTFDDDQRHPDGRTGANTIPDTHDHADLVLTHRGPAHGETHYIPGEGFLISHGGFSKKSKGRVYDQKKKEILSKRPKPRLSQPRLPKMADQGTYLTEDEILEMAANIHAYRKLAGAKGTKERIFEEARAKCHPGTDAVDSAKDGFHKESDEFDIDKSRSTLYIGLTSCGPPGMPLNGSKIYHHHVVNITVTGPDGQRLCEVMQSPEQFAATLFGSSFTPCTLSRYWSRGEEAVLLTERVRRPTSIRKRMEARLKSRLSEQVSNVQAVVEEMLAQANSGKPARKTALRDYAERLARAMDHSAADAAFTVDQAREEITGIMESAAIQFIGQQRIDSKSLWEAAGPALGMEDAPPQIEAKP